MPASLHFDLIVVHSSLNVTNSYQRKNILLSFSAYHFIYFMTPSVVADVLKKKSERKIKGDTLKIDGT